MFDSLLEYLKPKLLKLTVLSVLAFLFGTTIKAIFFQTARELTYDYKIVSFMCTKSDTCFYIGKFSIANTGSVTQANVEVTITNLPHIELSKPSVFDLSAAEPRKTDPIIRLSDTKTEHKILIKQFTPGALIKVVYDSLSVPKETVRQFSNPQVTVISEGQQIEADPRGTKLLRIWSTLF